MELYLETENRDILEQRVKEKRAKKRQIELSCDINATANDHETAERYIIALTNDINRLEARINELGLPISLTLEERTYLATKLRPTYYALNNSRKKYALSPGQEKRWRILKDLLPKLK